jgi:long-chain acyl-CoA synthetase
MVGDGRKYLAALITLSEDTLKEVSEKPGAVSGALITEPGIVGAVKQEVDALNRKLSSYEQIKRFVVLAKDFNLADGEMTPTLKVKRAVIEARYKEVIESLYR